MIIFGGNYRKNKKR